MIKSATNVTLIGLQSQVPVHPEPEKNFPSSASSSNSTSEVNIFFTAFVLLMACIYLILKIFICIKKHRTVRQRNNARQRRRLRRSLPDVAVPTIQSKVQRQNFSQQSVSEITENIMSENRQNVSNITAFTLRPAKPPTNWWTTTERITPYTPWSNTDDNDTSYDFTASIIIILISVVVCLFALYFIKCCGTVFNERRRIRRTNARQRNISQQHQHNNPIYNISSTVQNQERPPRYPAEAFLSLNHIQTHFQNTNETNKPSTFNDAPPSYEEAVKMVHTTTTTTTTTVIPSVHRSPPQTD